jgi:hypothetical protein
MENKGYYKKKGGEAHMGREWDSDESSTDSSSDEDAVNKGLLFPNVDHKCLMAKESKKKKIHSRDTPKYTTSDDEGSSSDDNEKFKFARSMLYNGRHPDIKDGIGFQQESQSNIKHNAPRTDSLILLRVRLPWFRIERVTFYILKTILSTRLGGFMLENLILFLIMHICIVMRLQALGIQLISKFLKRKLTMHQMNIAFHLRLLMHLLC